MRPKLIIHLKSGKSAALTLDETDARDYLRRYSDWLTVGDETEAPVIDARDQFGAGLVVHFSNIEFLEVGGR